MIRKAMALVVVGLFSVALSGCSEPAKTPEKSKTTGAATTGEKSKTDAAPTPDAPKTDAKSKTD